MDLFQKMHGLTGSKSVSVPSEHKFWKTQPVLGLDAKAESERIAGQLVVLTDSSGVPRSPESGPLEEKKLTDVQKEPYTMMTGYKWDTIDMTDAKQVTRARLVTLCYVARPDIAHLTSRSAPYQVEEVYQLLSNHYVEDDDAQFRFDYSRDFLTWCVLLLPSVLPLLVDDIWCTARSLVWRMCALR
jgi:glycylpeptide N-tetradecanoyltransferase